MLTLLLVASSLVQVVVAYLIFRKGRRNLSYSLFLLLSIVTIFWGLLSFISVNTANAEYATYFVRAVMFFATLQVGLFYLFAHTFPYVSKPQFKQGARLYVIATTVVAIISASPLLFESVSHANGNLQPQIGAGILAFGGFTLYSIVSSFRLLLKKLHYAVGLKRNQILLLLTAAVINWGIIPMTNFVLTLGLNTLFFVAISPIFSLIFWAIIAYALLRHRLFDAETVLWNSTIYVDYYLKNPKQRTAEYYKLQTVVYESGSNHVALDFSGIDSLKKGDVRLLNYLRNYMEKQGKKIYFIGYTQKVFKQLKLSSKLR